MFGTVPSTDSWIIKDVVVFNSGGAPVVVDVFAGNPAFTIFGILFSQSVAAGGFGFTSRWFAMGPSDTITVTPRAAGIHVWVSGADLPGHL
jgi:hypothetical protein